MIHHPREQASPPLIHGEGARLLMPRAALWYAMPCLYARARAPRASIDAPDEAGGPGLLSSRAARARLHFSLLREMLAFC